MNKKNTQEGLLNVYIFVLNVRKRSKLARNGQESEAKADGTVGKPGWVKQVLLHPIIASGRAPSKRGSQSVSSEMIGKLRERGENTQIR